MHGPSSTGTGPRTEIYDCRRHSLRLCAVCGNAWAGIGVSAENGDILQKRGNMTVKFSIIVKRTEEAQSVWLKGGARRYRDYDGKLFLNLCGK